MRTQLNTADLPLFLLLSHPFPLPFFSRKGGEGEGRKGGEGRGGREERERGGREERERGRERGVCD
jgi:hypothetical protein